MSTEIPFEDLFPVSGETLPTNGSDAVSGITYTSWALDTAARTTLLLPRNYQAGSKIVVRVQESTPGVAQNHKWSFAVTASSPTSSLISSDEYSSSVTQQITSPLVASRMQVSDIIITSNGVVDGYIVRPGDILSIVITRIAASTTEDINDIKLVLASLVVTMVGSSYSSCPGRVGGIIDRLLERFNDTGMGFASPSIVLQYINSCQNDLSTSSYWKEWRDLTVVSGQEEYDVAALIPDYVDIINVRWPDTLVALAPGKNMNRYTRFKRMLSSGIPQVWLHEGSTLYLAPTPDEGSTLELYISYTPESRDCDTYYDILTPKGYDDLYINYALAKECMRQGLDDSRRANMAGDFNALWMQDKLKLLGSRDRRARRIRSYRS